jgi:hypothetical protein
MPGNDEARALLVLGFAGAAAIIPIFQPHLLPGLAVPAAYVLPLVLAVGLGLTIRLANIGTADAPQSLLFCGTVWVVGGFAFDMTATMLHTPDLRQEANPIARSLLDTGHALPFVLIYGLVGQGLYALILCTLWAALLRHRQALTASLSGFHSPLLFLKAATGGADCTWRQWTLPLRFSELPWAYYVAWILAVVFLAGVADRWYLGLEWFSLVPRVRWVVIVVAVVAGLVFYLVWLWRASRDMIPAEQAAAAARPGESNRSDGRGCDG